MTRHSARRFRSVTLAAAVPLLLVTACSGGEEDDGPTTPEDVLAEAKTKLDETPGLSISLTTEELPEGVDGLMGATGTGTHAPAFEGEVGVRSNNLSLTVPVVAVQGQVFAKLPGWPGYVEIEAEEYGAPDPAELMDPATGLSSWLTEVEDVEEGDQVRDGDRVLTTYTGTLPGTAVAEIIPSASTDAGFDATFNIDDEGLLTQAVVTGPFYSDSGDVEYSVTFDDYGTDKDIARP